MSERINAGDTPAQGYAEDPLAHYTNVFVKFLQLVFARFSPGNYMWSEDPLNTEILITDQYPNLESVQKRPHLIVQRGGANNAGLALNMFQGGPDAETGQIDYTDLVSANITVAAISMEGRESQRLASTARAMIRAFRRDLMRGGEIFHIGPTAVGPEGSAAGLVVGDPGGTIAVVVNVPFFYQDFWSVSPVDKLLLNGVDLRVTSQAENLKPPAMNGQPLQVQTVFSLNSRTKVSRLTTPKPRK